MKTLVWISGVIALLAGSLVAGPAFADTYTFLYKDGFSASVYRTNNHGVSVGTSGTNALLLRDDGSFQLIPMPADAVSNVFVWGINDAEELIGRYANQTEDFSFFLKNGKFTILQVPGEGFTSPLGLNNRGTIVGNFTAHGTNTTQAFILKNGRYTKVAVPGAIHVTFWDVNDAGDIVGEATTSISPFQSYSFLYRDGTVIPLPTYPGADLTRAYSINNKGELTGQLITRRPGQTEKQEGFILRDGQFEVFRLLGTWAFNPYGINDKGEVTGSFIGNASPGFNPPTSITEIGSFIRRAK